MRSDLQQFRVLAVSGPNGLTNYLVEVDHQLLDGPAGHPDLGWMQAALLLMERTGMSNEVALSMVQIAEQCGEIVAFHPRDFDKVFPAE
ncbi:hypothetical protein [Actinomadura kijaniata]|uniref:hypothetical protein n=1 Tax=Actinomadura kijaniata TaxID=46161 RepID=UPI00082BF944|nr:hypothetical protein [Actinomadura kijaniata]